MNASCFYFFFFCLFVCLFALYFTDLLQYGHGVGGSKKQPCVLVFEVLEHVDTFPANQCQLIELNTMDRGPNTPIPTTLTLICDEELKDHGIAPKGVQ